MLIAHAAIQPPEALLEALNTSDSVASVLLARGAEEAVAHLNEGKILPSLVLVDLRLSGQGALQVARRIKERSDLIKIPIVALTPSRESIAMRSMRDLGVTSYLLEPIAPDQVSCLLAEVALYWRLIEDRRGDS